MYFSIIINCSARHHKEPGTNNKTPDSLACPAPPKRKDYTPMYYSNIIDLIGNTPLLSLKESTGYNIFAKAEFLNPGGSIKDRIAKNMIEVAEKEGKLKIYSKNTL